MNKMQEYLVRAGNDLGIRVIVPFELELNSGRKLKVEALLPDIGYSKGMIVSQSSKGALDIIQELKNLGYGYTVYDEPLPDEVYDVKSYKEMFIDWGWIPNWENG